MDNQPLRDEVVAERAEWEAWARTDERGFAGVRLLDEWIRLLDDPRRSPSDVRAFVIAVWSDRANRGTAMFDLANRVGAWALGLGVQLPSYDDLVNLMRRIDATR